MPSSVSSQPVAAPVETPPEPGRRRELPTLELLAAVLVAAVLLRPRVAGLVDQPALQAWSTFFVSIVVQALPFLTLGVVLSGAVAALAGGGDGGAAGAGGGEPPARQCTRATL